MPAQFNTSAIQEAFRRRAGQMPSTAGIPGGAPAANQMTRANPMATIAQRRIQGPAGPAAPGGAGGMSAAGISQLGKSQPGEAELILKAMARRLRSLPPYAPSEIRQQGGAVV